MLIETATKKPQTRRWSTIALTVISCGVLAILFIATAGDAFSFDEGLKKENTAANTGISNISTEQAGIATAPSSSQSDAPIVVKMTLPRQELAGMKMQTVTSEKMFHERAVPARLQFNTTEQANISAPVSALVTEVFVSTSQPVSAGQQLFSLAAPEILLLRNKLSQYAQQLAIAKSLLAWNQEVSNNLKEMLIAVENEQPVSDLDKKYGKQKIGESRAKLVAAYARYQLAKRTTANTEMASDSGALSGRLIDQRKTELWTAAADVQAVGEQATFDSQQAVKTAELACSEAEKSLNATYAEICHLQGLPHSAAPDDLTEEIAKGDRLVYFAPRSGIVISKQLSVGELLNMGSIVLTIGDLSQLWIRADLRSQDWDLLNLDSQTELKAEIVGLENRQPYPAKLLYIGSEVDANTGSIPLLASIDNKDGILRTGMFARLLVNKQISRAALTVPEFAVFRHQGKAFVFVQESAEQFRMQPVTTSLSGNGVVSVEAGLKDGDTIVSEGVFKLASEALLEREE